MFLKTFITELVNLIMSYNTNLEDRIDHFFIGYEIQLKKKEMDGVGWLINGNMCCGIYQSLLVVRTDPSLVSELIKKDGIQLFSHRKGAEDSFLSLSATIYENDEAMHKFLSHCLKYTATLLPKHTNNMQSNN